jgi:hypothetical protein
MKKLLIKIIQYIGIVAVGVFIILVCQRFESFHFNSYMTGLIVGIVQSFLLFIIDEEVTIK